MRLAVRFVVDVVAHAAIMLGLVISALAAALLLGAALAPAP